MKQFGLILRLLKRQGVYGVMAILGLTIGFVVAIFALLHSWGETHYDRHIPNGEQLYLVDALVSNPGRTPINRARFPGAYAAELRAAIPEISDSFRVWRQYSSVKLGDRLDFTEITAAVDPNFVQHMGLELVAGSATLSDTSSVIISEAMARRLFGSAIAVGESFTIDGTDFAVEGVFKDWPKESHTQFAMVSSIQSPVLNRAFTGMESDWSSLQFYTYLVLEKGADVSALRARAQAVLNASFQLGDPLPTGETLTKYIAIDLQNIQNLHLNGKPYPWQIEAPADILKLQILSAIAFLIIAIACINHVNMSTVRSMERAREVAVRKILGASRAHLIGQFLGEAALLAAIALLFALALVELSHSGVSSLLAAEINLDWMSDAGFLSAMAGLYVIVVLLAGGYPALLASAFRPGRILQANQRGARGAQGLRTFLVVFQFSVSIALAIGAAIIWNQISFARDKDLGFNPDNVVLLYGIRRSPEFTIVLGDRMKKSISGRAGVELVTGAGYVPGWDANETEIKLSDERDEDYRTVQNAAVDLDYFDTLKVEPVAGRLFGAAYGIDNLQRDLEARKTAVTPVIVNEAMVRSLGFFSAGDAVGQPVSFKNSDIMEAEIVGVVPDMHTQSLKEVIKPMVFRIDPSVFNVIMVRYAEGQRDIALQSIKEGWSAVLQQSISQDDLSVTLDALYDEEERQMKAVALLAGLGILVAVFGQYGLAAYSAQSRRREISIRKVLGARIADIVRLFVWQFSKPVFVAMLVAWPLAFMAASGWLENFAYRITPNPLWFLGAGLGALLIAMVTVAGHAFKAARARPIEALRAE